jgi:hypothetical protein
VPAGHPAIHGSYSLALADATADEARTRISQLHRLAADLPLVELGPLTELQGSACNTTEDDPLLTVKNGAMTIDDIAAFFADRNAIPSCRHLIGFSIFPAEGSHRCSFGLAIHAEGSTSWQWRDFCKTQYASSPECGGLQNFLRCHQAVLQLVDHCQELGILDHACDPSGYWEHHDLEQLVKCVNEYNIFTAAAIGTVKDALAPMGYSAEAPILERADFEHLEAQGRHPSEDVAPDGD